MFGKVLKLMEGRSACFNFENDFWISSVLLLGLWMSLLFLLLIAIFTHLLGNIFIFIYILCITTKIT